MPKGFSFNCPQCGKVYENVKSKMAGRKVRCECGKVFRLGPKTPEQIAETEAKKARKAAARKARTESEKSQNPASKSAKRSSPASKPNTNTARSADPVRDKNERAEPIPGRTNSRDAVSDQAAIDLSLFEEGFPTEISPDLFEQEADFPLAEDNLLEIPAPPPIAKPMDHHGLSAAAPLPRSKPEPIIRNVKRRGNDPMGGAIWTAIYTLPAFLIQSFVGASFFNTFGGGRSLGVTLISKFVGGVSLILAVMILVSGVFAVIEMVKGERILWPTKFAAIAGMSAIGANIFLMLFVLVGIGSRGGSAADNFGGIVIMFVLMSVVPVAAAITGFVRNRQE